jgi:hypothetical protein
VATVNKNFRIKNGLVVEGSTATINGYDILTKASADQNYIIDLIGGTSTSANVANSVVKRDASGNFSAGTITADLVGDVTGTVSSLSNHTTDNLSEGSNLYYTAARAKAEAADLLVNSNQTNIVITKDGSNNLTITAENGVADSTTDDLAEGLTRLYFTDSRARQAISGGTGISYDNTTGVVSVNNTIATKTYADNAATNAINSLDTDAVEEGSSNLYFTNGRARNAISGGSAISYNPADGIINVTSNTFDSYGAASTAEGNAQSYTDNAINSLTTSDIEEGSNLYFTDERAQDAVGNNVGNGLSYNDSTGAISVDTSVIANKSYVDTKVADLVDSAPALLDTLNELAAAIGDDANFVNTVTTGLSGKVSKSGDTMTGALTLNADPVNALHAATKQYADQAKADAVSSAESYTDGAILAGNAVAEPVYAAIDFNGIAKNVAASVNVPTASTVTAYEWNHNGFTSGKFTVKVAAGTHTELSEILVTSDTSNNIHFTEYGMVGTNGSLSTISADYNSNKIRIRVTTLNNNSTVVVAGTLIG